MLSPGNRISHAPIGVSLVSSSRKCIHHNRADSAIHHSRTRAYAADGFGHSRSRSVERGGISL